MTDYYVTNNHLKNVVDELKVSLKNEEDAPLELIANFICELEVSNLLIPAVEEDDAFAFEHIVSQDDESTYIPLFTDIDEYKKHEIEDSEFSPVAFDFDVYTDLILENELDGIILNVEGNFMPIEKAFIEEMFKMPEIPQDDTVEAYKPEELKDIFENVSNESLLEFIADEDSNDDIERLYVELSNSTLLNLVINDEPLDGFAKEGIIDADDVDGFSLCTIENDDFHLGAIFTDKDAISEAINADSGLFYYGQVTVLSELFDFILRNDMDGVVINPNREDYVIAREDILSQASGIEIIVENPVFRDSLDYAFLL